MILRVSLCSQGWEEGGACVAGVCIAGVWLETCMAGGHTWLEGGGGCVSEEGHAWLEPCIPPQYGWQAGGSNASLFTVNFQT